MKLSKHISFILLAAIYLASTGTYTVKILAEGIPASGADTIVAHDGNSMPLPQKLSMQRRHLPLTTDIPCPSVHISETKFPPIIDEESLVLSHPLIKHFNAYYYSSLCDRAPPIA